MRCVTYRRVSTQDQVTEGFSLEAQKNRLSAYITSQGWTHTDDYVDEGVSAKNTERPALQRLIHDIKQDKFDVVLVYRLDRFVRSVLDLHELLQMMEKYDVKFKSATEVFDTTSATGRLFITMIATLAQWERETIAERVHMGMMKRHEEGKRNGAPAPYGYDLEDGILTINQEEAKWVKFIFDKYYTNGSQNIAKQLNKKGVSTKRGEIWSDFSVRYILRNPIYTGTIRWNYRNPSKGKLTGEEVYTEYIQDGFEPIITNEVYEDVQRLLVNRRQMAFRSSTHYPFSGVARCAKCGKLFTGAKKKRKDGTENRFYKCRGRFRFGTCDVQAISEKSFEEAFLNKLDTTHVDIEENDNIDIQSIEKQIRLLQGKKERTEELYVDGGMSRKRYDEIMEGISQEELILINKLKSVELEVSSEEINQRLNDLKSSWHIMSYETKKKVIQSLFEYITFGVVKSSKGGPNSKPILSITDYKLV